MLSQFLNVQPISLSLEDESVLSPFGKDEDGDASFSQNLLVTVPFTALNVLHSFPWLVLGGPGEGQLEVKQDDVNAISDVYGDVSAVPRGGVSNGSIRMTRSRHVMSPNISDSANLIA
jgi:hypothetical protein